MAKEKMSTIDAAMLLVEKAIERLSNPCNDKKSSSKKKDCSKKSYEREFNEDLQEFCDLTFKKFCKELDLDREKKKSLKMYCKHLCTFLPTVGVFARYMANKTEDDLKKKEKIMYQFTSDTFIEYIKGIVNDGKDIPQGLEYYPLIVGTILKDMSDSDADVPDYLNDVTKIGIWAAQAIIEKLAKKCECPAELSFEIAMCVPTKDAFNELPAPWVKRKALNALALQLCDSNVLNKMVTNKKIPKFDNIFDKMDIDIRTLIVQILVAPVNDENSGALSAMTDWALDTLNGMDDDDQERIIRDYCFTANKIPNFEPRLIFSDLPSEYIKLRNVATGIKNNKKFDGQFDKILK